MAEDSGERGESHKDVTANSQHHEEDTDDENETDNVDSDDDEEEEDGDEMEDDDEPKLKYARMTGHMSQLYRNGDATSSFLVAGDKMVCLWRLLRS